MTPKKTAVGIAIAGGHPPNGSISNAIVKAIVAADDRGFRDGKKFGYEDAAKIAESIATEWLPSEESAESALRHGKKIAANIRSRANEDGK
jgi:hypothetical protein